MGKLTVNETTALTFMLVFILAFGFKLISLDTLWILVMLNLINTNIKKQVK